MTTMAEPRTAVPAPVRRGPTAPGPAAPAAGSATATTRSAPATPGPGAPLAAPDGPLRPTGQVVSGPVLPAQQASDEPAAAGLGFGLGDWILAGIGGLLASGVSGIGLASSYKALEHKAALPVAQGGWGWEQPWMLPVGLDLSVLAFSIINLVLIRADRPLGWVKWVPRLGAAGTIYLNWQSAASGPSQLGHAALVSLWVVFSEIAAHIYAAHIGAVKGRARMEGVRFSRWFLSPISTARIARRMKLWEITSYTEALRLDQDRAVYRQGLREKHGRAWRFKAPAARLQPLQLAVYGLSIDEALQVPAREAAKARLQQQAEALQLAEDELQRVQAESRIRTKMLEARAEEIAAQGRLSAAEAEAEAAASIRRQQAESDIHVRKAEAEAEVKRVAAEAEARVRELAAQEQARQDELVREREKGQLDWEAERGRILREQQREAQRQEAEVQQGLVEAQAWKSAEAAKARRVQQEEDERAAHAELQAAEARRQAAEADAKEAHARLMVSEAESARAASDRRTADEESAAAAARLKAAEDQVKAAAAELKAADLEAEARLTPVERDARKVADLIRAEGLEAITLARIEEKLGVSQGTASGRRKRAVQILQETGELPAYANA